MAETGKKPRVRKAPTVREIVESQSSLASQTARPKSRSKLLSFGPLKVVWAFLRLILRPIGKILGWLAPSYFINAWREVKQVTWPTRRETWRLTLAVFIFAAVFGGLVAIVDKGIDEIFKKVVLK